MLLLRRSQKLYENTFKKKKSHTAWKILYLKLINACIIAIQIQIILRYICKLSNTCSMSMWQWWMPVCLDIYMQWRYYFISYVVKALLKWVSFLLFSHDNRIELINAEIYDSSVYKCQVRNFVRMIFDTLNGCLWNRFYDDRDKRLCMFDGSCFVYQDENK